MRSIAVAQTIPVAGDINANLARHLRAIHAVAEETPQSILFPELSLTGYEIERAPELAFAENDTRLAPLLGAAKSCNTHIVAGAPIALEGRLHVGSFIISPKGRIDIYTKQRMGAFPESACCDGDVPPPERSAFEPGDSNPLLQFDGHTAALAICADIGDPAHAEAAAALGASTYLASMFVIPSEFDGECRKLAGYATRHQMAVAFANYGAASGGLRSAGRSSIWSQVGELLVQLPPSGAAIAVAREDANGWAAKQIRLNS